MKTVTFTPFEALGKDDRGTTTEIVLDRAGKALSIFRKEGCVFGNHYHSGSQVAKNPEIFWLLHGKLKFEYKIVEATEWQTEIIESATKMEIFPNIVHRVTALTDSYMLELNSLQEHIDDTVKL